MSTLLTTLTLTFCWLTATEENVFLLRSSTANTTLDTRLGRPHTLISPSEVSGRRIFTHLLNSSTGVGVSSSFVGCLGLTYIIHNEVTRWNQFEPYVRLECHSESTTFWPPLFNL
jgi:hypothetical protein